MRWTRLDLVCRKFKRTCLAYVLFLIFHSDPEHEKSWLSLVLSITSWESTLTSFSFSAPYATIHQVLSIRLLKYLSDPSAPLHPSCHLPAATSLPIQHPHPFRSPLPTPSIHGPHCCQRNILKMSIWVSNSPIETLQCHPFVLEKSFTCCSPF